MKNGAKKRLGYVRFCHEYLVDLDNQSMVDYAKEAIYDDINSMIKYDETYNAIAVVEAPKAKEKDIPDFLIEAIQQEEDWLTDKFPQ